MGNSLAQPTRSITVAVYLAWINAWMESLSHLKQDSTLSLDEQTRLFLQAISSPVPEYETLKRVASSFQHSLRNGEIPLGGTSAPSCAETNLASGTYKPISECSCRGLFPVPENADILAVLAQTNCTAIRNTINALLAVLERDNEWNSTSLYTPTTLKQAVDELILANSNIQPPPDTCQGPASLTPIPPIRAPDRRPNLKTDTHKDIHRQIYPIAEDVKFCVDAKYYFVLGAVPSDPARDGLIRAIADAGNDILIGDYCEVADDRTLQLLQQNGAAAVAFLKLCVLSGLFPEWAFDNMMSSMLHFRVLGYYRDHAREHDLIPAGVYGSRMNGLTVHRFVDLGLFFAVAAASLDTGETIDVEEKTVLSQACALINDLIDLRSDTARRQRENVVLRGVRGNLCEYLDYLVGSCLERAATAILTNKTCALVVMAFCNWSVMSSHHKVYEVSTQVSSVTQYEACTYHAVEDGYLYQNLLDALEPYGTLGPDGPHVGRTRAQLDVGYAICRLSEKQHLAWMADITRSLLKPATLRRIVDVVHFEWTGSVGDVDYCP
ncbi:hypothetical protein ASPWEDRAFT_37455 [Aspergillus wentii DTO 134E9]|uniref:Uncharacterized protein n=1 Tax=Aspergillus wentii DTO 134E9 TaxID=1073089 RepID=A0A1L9RXI0_ASPWE|nr:uncharacterized protein ASPWEDRAFT_37455 [Aspergillus wentii DTO 134E9]KAI9931689.1 hypothetical protein MW887_010266 [Aspergillus wentii]OJJ39636.1 hypothetical protein ASPWEDRAFT_37455 [Aspergillus wentii DTO 134E9]